MALSRARLELLLRLAEKNEVDASRVLSDSQRKHAAQQATELELAGYLREYEAQPLRHATPALLENRRQFLLRLSNAVDTQGQHVRNAAAQAEQARLAWIEMKNELRVAETMLEHGRELERRADERKQQREMDEFAITRRPPQAYANS